MAEPDRSQEAPRDLARGPAALPDILRDVRPLGSAGLLLAFLLGQLAIWSWQWIDYRRHVEEHQAEFDRYGEAILSAAQLAIYRECRGGLYDLSGLSDSLEEVREEIGSWRIELFDSDGKQVAQAGAPETAPAAAHLFTGELDVPTPRGGGGHRRGAGRRFESEDLTPLVPGGLRVHVLHPRGELDRRLDADFRHLAVTGTSLSLVLALAALALWMRLRSIQLSAQLAGADHKVRALEYLGRLGAGLAHETRNPLGIVRGHAQRIADGRVPVGEVEKTARTILDETDRTLTRLDEFLLLSRPAEPRRTRFAVRPLVEGLLELAQADAQDRGSRLLIAGDDFELDADLDLTRRLLLNLVLNALQSLDESGTVRVELVSSPARRAIRVVDDGCGIPEELRETIFEPYVTNRAGGTGLGLSIARRIADEHGWRLRFEPNRPRGTAMILEVPAP